MTNEPRAVIDTSVLVSAALLPRSRPRQTVDFASQRGRVLFSEATFIELDEVLRRPKFDRYVSEQTRLEFLVSLLHRAEVVPISIEIADCRDAKDNKILEVAVSGAATEVVSGDRDLLMLSPFRGIHILAVNDFLLKRAP